MIITKAAFFLPSPILRPLLPHALCLPDRPEFLGSTFWDLLVLNRVGCRVLLSQRMVCSCTTLLFSGDADASITQLIRAQQVISAGLSSQNSITFSSLQQESALICIQRTLLRWDGSPLEPQEMLRATLPLPAEEQLLLFGIQLLL